MTAKIGGKEIYRTFFDFESDRKHKCKICNGIYLKTLKEGTQIGLRILKKIRLGGYDESK